MKFITLIIFTAISSWTFAEGWRDTLEMARSAYRSNSYEKAYEFYQKAQKGAPKEVDLSDELAQSAYKSNKYKNAEDVYRQSASSASSKHSKARKYHNLGNSQMKQKNYQGAIESYKQALKNDPKNNKTRYNLSEAIRKSKEEQKKQQQNQKDQQQNQQQNQNQQQQQNQQNQQNQQQQQNKPGQPKEGKQGSKNLPNKAVERMLDDLMKAEQETKRKIGGNQGKPNSTNSGKDW
ncbi:MAG: tetratricopeptide repeat protein [Bacteroidota bacterium]